MLKRLLDVVLSVAALFLMSPILLCTFVVVRYSLGTPVLFRQKRPGKHAQPFTLFKFRTMAYVTGIDGTPLPDDMRLTKVGQVIRRLSLDEIPQLINVLRGEMSLVGPRPLLEQYLERYTPEQARRHLVKPGITGWAQVNGRNALTWDQKFELDIYYVDHASLRLDLKILFLTLLRVIKRDNINSPGEATAPEFMGARAKYSNAPVTEPLATTPALDQPKPGPRGLAEDPDGLPRFVSTEPTCSRGRTAGN